MINGTELSRNRRLIGKSDVSVVLHEAISQLLPVCPIAREILERTFHISGGAA